MSDSFSWGPLSDQFGRFRVILLSAILFVIGSVLCALSSNIELLIASRVVQGLGCCGLSVCVFAIIRDAFSGKTSSMVYSFINVIISVSPIIRPLIGVQLAINFRWQSAFVFLTGLAFAAFLIGSLFAGIIVNALGVYKTVLLGVACVFAAGILSLNMGIKLVGIFCSMFFSNIWLCTYCRYWSKW